MLVRVRVTPAGRLLALIRAVAVASLLVALPGCGTRSTSDSGLSIDCTVAPDPPPVGHATVTVTLVVRANAPVSGATVGVEGNMSHAGMEPVFAEAHEVAPGRYATPFAFTMAGDWVLTVDASSPGGARARKDVPVRGVRER